MTTFIGDICHPSGKYISNGEEKTRWLKIGAVFRKDNGDLRIKMDAFPADTTDSGGWLSVFPPRDNQNQQQSSPPQQQQGFRQPAASDFQDDDVPF